jgi:hypothetical protein
MRLGGNGMWGQGPAQRKNKIKKKKTFIKCKQSTLGTTYLFKIKLKQK